MRTLNKICITAWILAALAITATSVFAIKLMIVFAVWLVTPEEGKEIVKVMQESF